MADASGIFYRTLNRSRGPAVHGPRAQIDRELYLHHMQQEIFNTPNLSVLEGSIEDLKVEDQAITGVILESGQVIDTRHVIITTGTTLSFTTPSVSSSDHLAQTLPHIKLSVCLSIFPSHFSHTHSHKHMRPLKILFDCSQAHFSVQCFTLGCTCARLGAGSATLRPMA